MAHCRIDAILAPEANRAVVFRRSPSKLTQMLVWDLESDEVTPGQWLAGRVYTKRCDVSPDGRYVVIGATNYSRSRREHTEHKPSDPWMSCGWTAVSRPPYFTALALWFTGGAYNGGGIWRDRKTLAVNKFAHNWEEAVRPSRAIKVKSLGLGPSEDEPIFTMRLAARGWQSVRKEETRVTNPNWRKAAWGALRDMPTSLDEIEGWLKQIQDGIPKWRTDVSGLMEKPFERGFLRRETTHEWERWSLWDGHGRERRSWKPERWHPQWLDIDARGRVVFGDEGGLWIWPDFPDGKPRMVAQLDSHRFEALEASDWAKQW